MPTKALRPCARIGCPELVSGGMYCAKHKASHAPGFRALDNNKTDEQRKFYSSRKWTETSKSHRQLEPLCLRCKAAGRIVPAQMVHHNPPVEELIAQGLSPYDHLYLESLCNRCHLEELRQKRK